MESGFFVMSLGNSSIDIAIPSNHKDIEKLKNFIKNSFEEFYFGRNTIILYQDIMASQKMLERRKSMLEWLYKRSFKKGIEQNLSTFIEQNYKKTIKLNFVAQNLSIQTIQICIQQQSNQVVTIDVKNEPTGLIYNYLKAKFILHMVYQDRDSQSLKVRISSQKVLDELELLVNKKTLVGKKVNFTYPQNLFQKTSKVQNEQESDDSIKSKICKLKSSYKLLELNYLIKDMNVIKQRYKTLAKRYHPDSIYHQNPSRIKEYEEKFISIKEAYETICDFLSQKSA